MDTVDADMKIEDVRRQILLAARHRFDRYGFGKTTMAEIARDCGMSAANLYRYFASKGDIGASIAEEWFAYTEGRMAAMAAAIEGDAAAKLEALILLRIDLIAELIAGSPHIDELIDQLCVERLDLIAAHKDRCGITIAGILEEGTKAGVFAVEDFATTASTIQAATMKFYYPDFIRTCERGELVDEAKRVVALLVSGLGGRR
ncbi:MAG: hypothetical protein CMM50_02280 [Rhodospirillaceae bacterium]|nr:hypothetical protein [Rhodospirillaceae bacterium]